MTQPPVAQSAPPVAQPPAPQAGAAAAAAAGPPKLDAPTHSDQTKAPAQATPPAEQPDADDDLGGQQTFDAAYVRRLRRENQAKSAQARELAEKLQAIEDDNKSELQKAQEARAQMEKQLESVQIENMRAQVAIKKGLTPAMAARLVGKTAEEMEADADALLNDINQKFVAKQGASREATGAGVTGDGSDYESLSPNEMFKLMEQKHR